MTEQPAVCDTREEQYHLLVLDPTHTQILAARPARSWLLPFLKFRTHMPEALVFRPYLSRLGVDATPIHEALLRDGCGIDGGDCDIHSRRRASLHRVRSAHVRSHRRSPHLGTDPRSPRRRRRVAHSDPEDRDPHLPRTLSARRRPVRFPRAASRRPSVAPRSSRRHWRQHHRRADLLSRPPLRHGRRVPDDERHDVFQGRPAPHGARSGTDASAARADAASLPRHARLSMPTVTGG